LSERSLPLRIASMSYALAAAPAESKSPMVYSCLSSEMRARQRLLCRETPRKDELVAPVRAGMKVFARALTVSSSTKPRSSMARTCAMLGTAGGGAPAARSAICGASAASAAAADLGWTGACASAAEAPCARREHCEQRQRPAHEKHTHTGVVSSSPASVAPYLRMHSAQ